MGTDDPAGRLTLLNVSRVRYENFPHVLPREATADPKGRVALRAATPAHSRTGIHVDSDPTVKALRGYAGRSRARKAVGGATKRREGE